MVSGHLFHCRKNSWPPEEYVPRTALQLVRRALVSVAKTFFLHPLFSLLRFLGCGAAQNRCDVLIFIAVL
jgi:hypothetical protein